MKKLSKEEFIERAKKIHGDKYDYSKVEYNGNNNKVCIICPIHGEFWQSPSNHLAGKGCAKCKYEIIAKSRRVGTEKFIERAKSVHGDKYDYSKVLYKNEETPVTIICPIHGNFTQKPCVHLMGCGCPKCAKNGVKISQDDFIKRAKEVHGDKYDYSQVKYINAKTPVRIICHEKDILGNEHGEFLQSPHSHLRGAGCPKCANKNVTTELFIAKAKKVHGDRYDYSKVEYVNSSTEVCIICPEHGEFWQKPSKHLSGHGCPTCYGSKLEKFMRDFLSSRKINFIEQKTFPWLKFKKKMFLDFYLPEYKIAIECQGKQHFLENCGFSNHPTENLKIIQTRDFTKQQLCKENGIKLINYSNLKINFPYDVIKNEEELLKELKKLSVKISYSDIENMIKECISNILKNKAI